MTARQGHELERGRTPTRVIALDWYDGPILGLVEYEADGETNHYRFVLVGGIDYDSRFFLLADVMSLEWEDTTALLQETSLPSWPVWALHVRGASEDWRGRADEMVRKMRGRANLPVAVIEAESIERPIIAVRRVGEDERALVTRMSEENSDHEAWVALLS